MKERGAGEVKARHDGSPVVLILCNNDGGLYKFRRGLLERLVGRYRVVISCPEGDFAQDIRALGAELINTPMERRGTNPLRDLKLLRAYMRLMKQYRPLAVLTYTVKPNIYGGIAARLYRRPRIANITGLGTAVENGGLMQKLLMAMYRPALRGAHCVCFQNEANRDFFNSNMKIGRQVLLCGSGVDLKEHTAEPYPEDAHGVRLLFIGRMMRAKGVDELLAAAQRLKNEGENISFTLVGGCDEAEYEAKLSKLTREGVIDWVGEKRSVKPYIAECHAVVNPSHHEGMSNVLLEAAATARPVIASDIPGCRETFAEGKSGFGFAAGDAEALYLAVKRFAALPNERRAEMGAFAREFVEKNFDRETVIRTYTDLIEELL